MREFGKGNDFEARILARFGSTSTHSRGHRFEAARARRERPAQLVKDLKINTGLKGANNQNWMWDWHQKLRARLTTAVKALKATEKKGKGTSCKR